MPQQDLIQFRRREEAIRVLVVDDHALFAEALMITLAIEERIEVVGCASNGAEATGLAAALHPDVVLMDVHMPVLDGIEATRRIRRVSPRTRVVMLTAAQTPEVAAHALAAGAVQCLTKDTSALKLIDVILTAPTAATVTPIRQPQPSELRAGL
jgi:DNA-binding NarL/FixJ family response regulator